MNLLGALAMRMMYRYAYKCGGCGGVKGKILRLLLLIFAGNRMQFESAAEGADERNNKIRIAIIGAVKECGAEKDWEKIHVDDVLALSRKQTGKCADLPKGVTARREYDKIAFYKNGIPHRADAKIPRDFRAQSNNERLKELAFGEGEKIFGRFLLNAERVPATVDVKSGFYIFIFGKGF